MSVDVIMEWRSSHRTTVRSSLESYAAHSDPNVTSLVSSQSDFTWFTVGSILYLLASASVSSLYQNQFIGWHVFAIGIVKYDCSFLDFSSKADE